MKFNLILDQAQKDPTYKFWCIENIEELMWRQEKEVSVEVANIEFRDVCIGILWDKDDDVLSYSYYRFYNDKDTGWYSDDYVSDAIDYNTVKEAFGNYDYKKLEQMIWKVMSSIEHDNPNCSE